MSKTFDPRKFIDREFEQELFEQFLLPSDTARLMTITDKGGMGKSHLLRQFLYRCRAVARPRIPVCLVTLDEQTNSPWALVNDLVKGLRRVPFPSYKAQEEARLSHDFRQIEASHGAVNLEGADLRQSQQVRAAGMQTNIDAHQVQVYHTGPSWTGEQQEYAKTQSVLAFCADLASYCQSQPVVILLDTLESCPPDTREWLEFDFLGYCLDDHVPPHLRVVIAGRDSDNGRLKVDLNWPAERCDQRIKRIASLKRWQLHHVRECLDVHGFHYGAQAVETFYNLITMGMPPQEVVQTMERLLPKRAEARR